jgi:hypothetical protein
MQSSPRQPTRARQPDSVAEGQDVMPAQRVTVQVEDRQLVLSNLDKELYPADWFSKRRSDQLLQSDRRSNIKIVEFSRRCGRE